MNKSNAKDFLPLVQALADGKRLQRFFIGEHSWYDVYEIDSLEFEPSAYRIMPEVQEMWVNIYPSLSVVGYRSREFADGIAADTRIACVKVTYTEGEGL